VSSVVALPYRSRWSGAGVPPLGADLDLRSAGRFTDWEHYRAVAPLSLPPI